MFKLRFLLFSISSKPKILLLLRLDGDEEVLLHLDGDEEMLLCLDRDDEGS